LPDTVPTPRDPSEHLNRISVDLNDDETAFVDQFAAYKNAMAVVQNETLRVKWKRKSMGENLLQNQIVAQRFEMAAQFKAVGPLPADPEDDAANQDYARRVLAWQKKRAK
jgi:hypothetical protein